MKGKCSMKTQPRRFSILFAFALWFVIYSEMNKCMPMSEQISPNQMLINLLCTTEFAWSFMCDWTDEHDCQLSPTNRANVVDLHIRRIDVKTCAAASGRCDLFLVRFLMLFDSSFWLICWINLPMKLLHHLLQTNRQFSYFATFRFPVCTGTDTARSPDKICYYLKFMRLEGVGDLSAPVPGARFWIFMWRAKDDEIAFGFASSSN